MKKYFTLVLSFMVIACPIKVLSSEDQKNPINSQTQDELDNEREAKAITGYIAGGTVGLTGVFIMGMGAGAEHPGVALAGTIAMSVGFAGCMLAFKKFKENIPQ